MSDSMSEQYSKSLDRVAEELDIPPNKYQQAVDRYTSVGKWLEAGTYQGSTALPRVYPQGSFRLGTVVRPVREEKEADYDIDLVCELQVGKNGTHPRTVKTAVGERLEENDIYREMLDDEGRRCWTLQYAEQDEIGFHLDVLPAIPEESSIMAELVGRGIPVELAAKAIGITDRDGERFTYRWSSSNPEGYARWFDQRKKPIFDLLAIKEKQRLFESNKAVFRKVDDVPDILVKTPLQRAIQILKRHRDRCFLGREWSIRPISMIITTLSALLYGNESDAYSTLKNIVAKLEAHSSLFAPGFPLDESLGSSRVMWRDTTGAWHIPNPVNPRENFADKWHENDDEKAHGFFRWVSMVRKDIIDILGMTDGRQIRRTLEKGLGEEVVRRAFPDDFMIGTTTGVVIGHRPPSVEIRNPGKPWGFH